MSHAYDFREIEPRWQRTWAEQGCYRAANPGEPGSERPKFYVLDFFPYPSGAGLHVGHPLGYIASDIIARSMRMRGHNVLHPMGWDAFGLPAEQYAIETGVHPADTTRRNIDTYRRQLQSLGLSYDWSREIATIDENYYRWTQWIFLQIYSAWYDPEVHWTDAAGRAQVGRARSIAELPIPDHVRQAGASAVAEYLDAHRLAYLAEVPVNWCPALGTVLANEEVNADGRSERGNHPVYRRPMKQWMLRITDYADRLLSDLEPLDWPEPIKLMQRNWIGRSEGAYVDFEVEADDPQHRHRIRVFTTRPDTLFGATYVVLAPEHRLVPVITTDEQRVAVDTYVTAARQKSELDRTAETRNKSGVFTGAYAINPVNAARIPIWVADYVLAGYGTGSIMAVPGSDQRDFDFAQTYNLPIVDVVYPTAVAAAAYFVHRATQPNPVLGLWRETLADFLGFVVSEQTRPEQFDAAYERLRERRKDNLREPPREEGLMRGVIASDWLAFIDRCEWQSLEDARDCFDRGEFHKRSGQAYSQSGTLVNSPRAGTSSVVGAPAILNGRHVDEAKRTLTAWLEAHQLGEGTVQYKLRDWLFSRQRYWGEPFPILYADNGETIPVPESDLPVRLPPMDDFRPTATDDPHADPQTPLSRATGWAEQERDGRRLRRELNTMPQWAGSCWYYLRFADPHNAERMIHPDAERYWLSAPRERVGAVDLYMGGAEHAVLHLLYARFWHKVLYDLGYVSTPEPFQKLFNQGYIQAFAYRDARGFPVDAADVVDADGRKAIDAQDSTGPFYFRGEPVRREYGKMGKSLKNVVGPDEIVAEFGADTLRLYEMSLGPLEASKPWSTRDIVGVHRFLQRVWRLVVPQSDAADGAAPSNVHPRLVGEPDPQIERLLHKTIQKVQYDVDRFALNTAVSQMIVWANEAQRAERLSRDQVMRFLRVLAPFAPHICEELWLRLGGDGLIVNAPWPAFDDNLIRDEQVEIAVQVRGKVRGRILVPADATDEQVATAARALDSVAAELGDAPVRRTIVVKHRLVNFVL